MANRFSERELELMQMAIDESRHSISEHVDKEDPFVGAIVTDEKFEVLAKAHRGELREGEHCEFTLIERKLRGENLTGKYLFVTLEPCVDAIRKKPKRGCSTWVSKARFARVYIGIEDPDIAVKGLGYKVLADNKITISYFPSSLQDEIIKINAAYIKEKESQRLRAEPDVEFIKGPPKTILEEGQDGDWKTAFSKKALQNFFTASGSKLKYPSQEFLRWASRLKFVDQDEKTNQHQATGLGLLLFGRTDEISMPHASFKLELNYPDGKTEIKDFHPPLTEQLPAILEFVKSKGLRMTIDRSEGERQEKSDFPFEVVREAIANAVIHRDYTDDSQTNYIRIDADKILVRSPGVPYPPLTIEDLRGFDPGSHSRNPKIMFVFDQMKLSERRGIGLRNMRDIVGRGFPRPEIRQNRNMLEFVLGRTQDFLSEILGRDIWESLSEEERVGLSFVRNEGEVSKRQFAESFALNDKTAQRQLAKFAELGLLTLIGAGPSTRYRYTPPK